MQIASTYIFIMDAQKWSLFLGFGVTDKPCFESSHSSNITRWCYSQLSISKTRIILIKTKSIVANLHGCRQTASLQKQFLRTSLKLQIIRLAQGKCPCTPTHWKSYYYSYTYEKTNLAVHFTKMYFFVNLLAEKLWV